MKKLLGSTLAWMFAALCFYAATSQAVIIEGTTPQGTFRAVGLDAQGHFLVASSTSGVPTHVITDTGSVVAIPGVVRVEGAVSATPLPVTGPAGGPVAVTGSFQASASTAGIVNSAQVAIGSTAFPILAADVTRKQSIVCNGDESLTVWLGPAGVTIGTGIALGAGGCMTPDVPASFTGALFGISSATTSGKVGVMTFK